MLKIIKKILYVISRSKTLTKVGKKILDYNRNENNCDFETNGEAYFVRNNILKFNIIFDVGANIGEWSNYMSKLSPANKIYSFEPSKKTFQTLGENIRNKNILPFNIGFGEKQEDKVFYNQNYNSTLNSSIKRESLNDTYEEIVQFDTIDNFCLINNINNISFLKIDVEGNELNVLIGAQKLIEAGKIDYIQFEYGGTYIDADIFLKDIFDFFKNKPYLIHKIMQKDIIKIEKYDQELENFQYSNFLAILNNKC